MYYERVMKELNDLKSFVNEKLEEEKYKTNSKSVYELRKRADALGSTGRNLADVYGIHNIKMLVKAIQEDLKRGNFDKFEIGDFIIVPGEWMFNTTKCHNWQFDLIAINYYKGVGIKPDMTNRLVFISRKTILNTTWPGDMGGTNVGGIDTNTEAANYPEWPIVTSADASYYINPMKTLANILFDNSNQGEPNADGTGGFGWAWQYFGEQRQNHWTRNHMFLLGEQNVGEPQNTFAFGNSNSCQFIPLFKRSASYRIKRDVLGNRNTWWLASRDTFNNNISGAYCFFSLGGNFADAAVNADSNLHNHGVVPCFTL